MKKQDWFSEKKTKIDKSKTIKSYVNEIDRLNLLLETTKNKYQDSLYEIQRKEKVIVALQSDYDYLKQTMEATQLMLNFAKWQIDVYEKILDTKDCCNE
jgi:DNA repair exonuclease SbcCD ATPase subunit